MKSPTIWASFRAAFVGLVQSAAEGRNIRFHWLAGYTVLLLGFWLKMPPVEHLILILVVAQVLAAEMVNTSVEMVTDLAAGGFHPLAKKAKDIAAGAVLVTSLASVAVAFYLFLPRIGGLPELLGARLADPDAGTILGVAGFVVLLGFWAVSLTPAWGRRHAPANRQPRGPSHTAGTMVNRADGTGGPDSAAIGGRDGATRRGNRRGGRKGKGRRGAPLGGGPG